MGDDVEMLTGDVARVLRVSPARVDQLERTGVLRARRTLSGVRIYRAADVEALRRKREQERAGR